MHPLLLLAAGFVIEGTVRQEVRAGPVVNGQDPNAAMVGADLNGHADGPDGSLRFGLTPSATVGQNGHLQFFARGSLSAELRDGGRIVRLRQRGGYGTLDLTGLTPGAAPDPNAPRPVPSAPATRYATVQEAATTVELELQADRRTRVTATGGWAMGGGADSVSQESLPLARGPLARAQLDWAMTPLDTLRGEISAIRTTFSNHRSIELALGTAGWQAQPWRSVHAALSAGAGYGRASGVGPATASFYPVGNAEARVDATTSFSFGAGGAVQPLGDPASGDLVERGLVFLAADWRQLRDVSIGGRVTGSVALTSGSGGPTSPQAGDRFLQAELAGSVPVGHGNALLFGGRAAVASRPLLGQPKEQWAAFVAFSFGFRAVP